MSFWGRYKGVAEGSVFAKIAHADTKVLDAKGRIAAADAFHEAKHKEAEFLEAEADRLHADSADVHSRFDTILDRL